MIIERLLYAVVYVVEAITAWLYFSYIYKQIKSNQYTFLSFSLGYTVLFFTSKFDVLLLNGTLFFVVNTIILYLNYSCEIKSSVLHSAFITFVMGISEILVNLFITYVTDDYTAYTYNFSALISLTVPSKLLYLFITIVAARFFKPHKVFKEEPSQIALLCVMPTVSIIIVITFNYIGYVAQLTSLTEIMIAVSSIALLLVNIVVLFVYNRIQKLDEEHAEFQLSQLRDKADAEYYDMLQQQYDGQRILIHDIKKHLNAIDLMAEEGNGQKIREYISELENMPEFRHKARLCDNPILNMILLENAEFCAANDISFSCDVRAGSVSFMDDTSITALFGNLLSNAVEAAQESEEKRVDLSVIKNVDEEHIVIYIENSCDSAPEADYNGNLKTTKKEQEIHGYGMKSINRVIQKYGGLSMPHYEVADKTFRFTIWFSLRTAKAACEND